MKKLYYAFSLFMAVVSFAAIVTMTFLLMYNILDIIVIMIKKIEL